MNRTTQRAALAARFDDLQSEAVATLMQCDDACWLRTTAAEGWTVAATAHHLANVQRAFVAIVEKLAAGMTYTPASSMEQIHRSNAEHAREFADADRQETLALLESSGAAMSALLHGFDDDGLARPAGTFGGNQLSVAQFVEYVVIGHAREHLDSIQQTIDG